MELLTSGQWQAWPLVQACIKAAFLLLGFKMGLFFFEGYQIRMKFRKMKEQGIPIAEPHSLVWGHLKMMVAIRAHFPKDAHNHYAQIYLVQNWQKFFPGAEERPPIMYFDLWPVLEPFAFVVDPAMCQDIVQDRLQPRHPQIKHLIKYISGARNLTGWDQPVHTLWRSRLNPGFSARNLQSHIPTFIEEVETFVGLLKANAPKDGAWGEVFQLLNLTTNMTFDIICRVAMNLDTNEQRVGPTELQNSMRTLVRNHVIFKNLGTLPLRLSPSWNLEAWRCSRTLRRALMPRIQEQIGSGEQAKTQKTVIQLATKEISNESSTGGNNKQSLPLDKKQYSEDVLNLMKQFLFAGHDTTSTTITWAFHFLAKHPAALEQLRTEHTTVFGPDPSTASAMLTANPALLNALPYTNAVIKEVLRLSPLAATIRRGSPSFFFTHHSAASGTTRHYPTDGFAVATGTAAMHHDPALWPRANEFIPERYLVSEGHELYPVKYAWRPFEYGPMNCIGQDLALMELRLVLLLTVRELDVETAWEEWDALQVAGDEKPPTINGDRAYRTTNGLSYPTDELPVHVRLRNP
ncbi:cytochrome P450 4V3 [Apiospora rasikravindrae]|uniref:Cytochrome P450 4V3 n=1 Tax=Apiospora rasikravindrae TaxID=990691 RepID=A0ABR1TXX8_9PEZI